jgi:glucose-1-phosphate adenylyltransferase
VIVARAKVLTLILAGGSGGRLEVLTEGRAKPTMPFGGTYRLIDFALSNCMHSHLSDVWIIVQYEPHGLNEHLANGRPWDLDRTYGGLQVLPPFESKAEGGFAQGNADAIYRHRNFIREFDPDLVIVLSADHVYKLDYREVIDRHLEREANLTIVTTRVPLEEASRFGTVQVDERGRVTQFAYKPDHPQSDLVTTEVFVYNADVLLGTLDELAGEGAPGDNPEEQSASLKDFGHKLLPRLVSGEGVWEHRLEGYWRDVGVIESYWRAHMDLLMPDPPLALDDPDWPILTYGAQRLPARIEESARIENSLVSPGCRVAGRVVRSVLGPGVVVENGAVVRNSIVLQDTVIEAGASIACAIVDVQVRIGSSAAIGRTDELGGASTACAATDIAIVGQRSRIAAGARVEPGARVKPETAEDGGR